MRGPLDGKARLGHVVIARMGDEATISRADGTAPENQYGKIEDDDRTFSDVATEEVFRGYTSSADFPDEANAAGGRLNSDDPRLAFKKDTAAQEDDRVTFSDTGRTYVLKEEIPRPTHTLFRATLVNA